MRRTKIIATLGPASATYEKIEQLAQRGVNIFRLNFSHSDHKGHQKAIEYIKRLNKKLSENFAVLLDTKGPEIRSGDINKPIEVKKGDSVTFSIEPGEYEETGKIGVNYDAFIKDVSVGEKILLDNGVINFTVSKKTKTDVICECHDDGIITSRRHINLPGKNVSLESITEKDWADINFGIEMGVDFIALSFVRTSEEIKTLKNFLKKKKTQIDVIAKIENQEAMKNLDDICKTADGVMVARGDLGAEIPFEQVPKAQREIIEICAQYSKPVIVATHMLESMIKNPIPTRAEVTDIATAVWQRSDAIMLSGETAGGIYPKKSVETMSKIALNTESEFLTSRPIKNLVACGQREIFAKVASRIPEISDEADAIVVITRRGSTAQYVSRFRPRVPIFAFTNEPRSRRRMQFFWGVKAFRIEFSISDPQKTIKRAKAHLLKHDPTWKGKKFVLLSDVLIDGVFSPQLQFQHF